MPLQRDPVDTIRASGIYLPCREALALVHKTRTLLWGLPERMLNCRDDQFVYLKEPWNLVKYGNTPAKWDVIYAWSCPEWYLGSWISANIMPQCHSRWMAKIHSRRLVLVSDLAEDDYAGLGWDPYSGISAKDWFKTVWERREKGADIDSNPAIVVAGFTETDNIN